MEPIKNTLLDDIDQFLDETGMSESYFGKRSVGNSELVSRLRKGGRVWPETASRVLSFIQERRNASATSDVSSAANIQDPQPVTTQGDAP